MPQQINLCTPILLTQKRYFSAQTMAQALAIFVLLGGSLCVYGVWSLNAANEGFKKSLLTQSPELESLQAALKQGAEGTSPVEIALAQELLTKKAELLNREKLMLELQHGLLRPGWGHAARLQLLAQSIPSQVWVTEVKADENQLDVRGYTLEPSMLNDWVAKLASSPLLKGQGLSTIKVENARAAVSLLPGVVASAPTIASRQVWSFHLVSALNNASALSGSAP